MFKAILIIFIISTNDNNGSGWEVNTAIDITPFETIEQCEFIKEEVNKIKGSYSHGERDNRKPIEIIATVKCKQLPESMQSNKWEQMKEELTQMKKPTHDEFRRHKRWNDT